MKILNKKFIIFFLIAGFFYFGNFNTASANLPFGGRNLITSVPCSCTGGLVWYSWLTPLYLGTLMTGPVAFGVPPTTLWYSTYTPIAPRAWSLGRMIPLVQTCWSLGYPSCFPIVTEGHVYMTGSSSPAP